MKIAEIREIATNELAERIQTEVVSLLLDVITTQVKMLN